MRERTINTGKAGESEYPRAHGRKARGMPAELPRADMARLRLKVKVTEKMPSLIATWQKPGGH